MLPYTEKLVTTWTPDDLRLDGVVLRPATPRPHRAIVLIHGAYGCYASPTIIGLGRLLAERDWLVVAGNTRGHDLAALVPRRTGEPKLAGGLWEIFDEAKLDVRAWMDYTADQGAERIGLVGHSMGGAKVGYYAVSNPDDSRLTGLVLASPPGGQHMANASQHYAEALRLVQAGQPDTLVAVPEMQGGLRSAEHLVNRFRPDTNFDPFGLRLGHEDKLAPAAIVKAPILAFFGSQEPYVGGQRELDLIQAHAAGSAGVTTQLLPGLDHVYTGQIEVAATLISDWLERL